MSTVIENASLVVNIEDKNTKIEAYFDQIEQVYKLHVQTDDNKRIIRISNDIDQVQKMLNFLLVKSCNAEIGLYWYDNDFQTLNLKAIHKLQFIYDNIITADIAKNWIALTEHVF